MVLALTGRATEPAKYPGLPVLFLLSVLMLASSAACAQAPDGRFVAVGPAVASRIGGYVGIVEAGRFLTREVVLGAGYEGRANGSVRGTAMLGGAIRVLGSQRTVFNTAYRALDLDLGIRIGPALVFRFDESVIDRNRRFTLLVDPFVRAIWRRGPLWVLEVGVHQPSVRAGVWIPV